MKYGVCGDTKAAEIGGKAGFDYFEMSVPGLLKPLEPRQAFLEELEKKNKAAIPCHVCNCMLPGDLKVCGPDMDMEKLTEYMETTCQRAGEAGIELIVFGSGASRKIPDGFDREEALNQLETFAKMAAEKAAKYNVTIVLEPLNHNETNVFLSVGEGAEFVKRINHPNFRLLVDSYHWMVEDESSDNILKNISLIKHAHAATGPNRLAPGKEDCKLDEFFKTLRLGGYNGGVSVEAKIEDPEQDYFTALASMKDHVWC